MLETNNHNARLFIAILFVALHPTDLISGRANDRGYLTLDQNASRNSGFIGSTGVVLGNFLGNVSPTSSTASSAAGVGSVVSGRSTPPVETRGPSARYHAPGTAGAGVRASNSLLSDISGTSLSARNIPGGATVGTLGGSGASGNSFSGGSCALPNSTADGPPMSAHCGPRLIVFILGGYTLSEAKICYEITRKVCYRTVFGIVKLNSI
ncbi:unnamed protein product [Protopolystoma xenopodis]|uniref:Syntaxin binding protein n=1 Tax=Protopolystoma xenopodis TaxID=117903 RepID=A0A3S5AT58_9PLAT|nr:unnamed protein product [Protopolystoma xenopodis]